MNTIFWVLLVVLLIVGASGLWRLFWLYCVENLPDDEHDEHEEGGIG